MPYVIPAARRLIEQVKSDEYTLGDPDGFGHVRSVTFPASVGKWLAPALEVINDNRVQSVEFKKGKPITVTFVADSRADFNTAFPIPEVSAILDA